MFYRIAFFLLYCASLFSTEHIYLETPNIARENIIGTTVGIRPFRKTGVRLEAEWLHDKLIIHNYGYGGSGLTLSFGGASEVLEILENQKASSNIVAILGAGVVGLATAYDLLEKGYEVHLYADQWNPNLTSNVAAGIWTPLTFPSDIPEEKKSLHQRMLAIAEQRFLKSTGPHPEFAGVKLREYYRLTTDNPQAVKTMHQGEEVIFHFDNGLIKNGLRSTRLAIEGKLFMDDLQAKVKSKGALLNQKHFDKLEEVISLKEPIIINCLSMGSRELFNDGEFIPVRGQMIYFKPQAGMDYVLSQAVPLSPSVPNDPNNWVALYPWSDRIILGGINEHGNEEMVIDEEVIDTIMKNAEKCLSGDL